MGRENRFKNLQTRLNKQTNLCKLQSYKHVSINFKLPNKAVQKPCKVQSKLSISSTDTSFQPTFCSKIHNQNSCFITQIIKGQIKLQFLVNKSIFGTRLIVFVTHSRSTVSHDKVQFYLPLQ